MNDLTKNILLWVVIVLVLLAVFSRYMPPVGQPEDRVLRFLNDVKANRSTPWSLQGDMIYGKRKDTQFKTLNPETDYTVLIGTLQKANVVDQGRAARAAEFPGSASAAARTGAAAHTGIRLLHAPDAGRRRRTRRDVLRQEPRTPAGRGPGQRHVRRRRRLSTRRKRKSARSSSSCKDPGKFQKLGGKIPQGRADGRLAGHRQDAAGRAIAGEAKVPFFTISGSDFVEMFVGVGASRVRDMFEQAKKHAPCIIFIDEIDAVGRHRGAGLGGGHDEREQTLNQLLVEMDGFEGNEGIIVIAATNRPDVLDPALLRPGRFDRQVVVPLPDVRGREQILQSAHAPGAARRRRRADDRSRAARRASPAPISPTSSTKPRCSRRAPTSA